jgi:hypothetical protein
MFWYHGGYIIITVIHRDFTGTTEYSFCNITVSRCDSNIPTMIPNTQLDYLKVNLWRSFWAIFLIKKKKFHT